MRRFVPRMGDSSSSGMHLVITGLTVVQVLVFIIFGCMVASKHQSKNKPMEVLSMHWGTAMPTQSTNPIVLSVAQHGKASDMVQSCAVDHAHTQQFQNCAMSKLPKSFTYINSAESLWPGDSYNEPYLLFVLAIVHAQFALLHLPISVHGRAIPGPDSATDVRTYLVGARTFCIVVMQILLMALTVVSLWAWNIGFSSAFLGIVFIVLSVIFVWDLLYLERESSTTQQQQQQQRGTVRLDLLAPNPDGTSALNSSVMEYAMRTEQTYNLHLVRSICTTPIVVFSLLAKLSPFELDLAYIIPIVSCILLAYAQILLERRLILHDESNATTYSPANFKTEKVAYLVAGVLFAIVFLFSFTAETFFAAWQLSTADNANYANVYMTFFVVKCVELGLGFLLYMIDDAMTYQRAISSRMQIVADWSNTRYLLFTAADTVVALWLICSFWFDV